MPSTSAVLQDVAAPLAFVCPSYNYLRSVVVAACCKPDPAAHCGRVDSAMSQYCEVGFVGRHLVRSPTTGPLPLRPRGVEYAASHAGSEVSQRARRDASFVYDLR